jgi:hypothetical protein
MKTILLWLCTLLWLWTSCAFACQPVTISAIKGTLPNTNNDLAGSPRYNQGLDSYAFPFVVPDGVYLGITDVMLSSKYLLEKQLAQSPNVMHSNNYLVLVNVLSVPEHSPNVHLTRPLPLPPGFVLNASVINNTSTSPAVQQNMLATVLGYLSTDPLFKDCK